MKRIVILAKDFATNEKDSDAEDIDFGTSGLILSSTPPLKTFSKSWGTSVTWDVVYVKALRRTNNYLTIAVQVELPVKLAEGWRPRHLSWIKIEF